MRMKDKRYGKAYEPCTIIQICAKIAHYAIMAAINGILQGKDIEVHRRI
jgi:hypothetical protein